MAEDSVPTSQVPEVEPEDSTSLALEVEPEEKVDDSLFEDSKPTFYHGQDKKFKKFVKSLAGRNLDGKTFNKNQLQNLERKQLLKLVRIFAETEAKQKEDCLTQKVTLEGRLREAAPYKNKYKVAKDNIITANQRIKNLNAKYKDAESKVIQSNQRIKKLNANVIKLKKRIKQLENGTSSEEEDEHDDLMKGASSVKLLGTSPSTNRNSPVPDSTNKRSRRSPSRSRSPLANEGRTKKVKLNQNPNAQHRSDSSPLPNPTLNTHDIQLVSPLYSSSPRSPASAKPKANLAAAIPAPVIENDDDTQMQGEQAANVVGQNEDARMELAPDVFSTRTPNKTFEGLLKFRRELILSIKAIDTKDVTIIKRTDNENYIHYNFIAVSFNNIATSRMSSSSTEGKWQPAAPPKMNAKRPWKLVDISGRAGDCTEQLKKVFKKKAAAEEGESQSQAAITADQVKLAQSVITVLRFALTNAEAMSSGKGWEEIKNVKSFKRSLGDYEADQIIVDSELRSVYDMKSESPDAVLIDFDEEATAIRLHIDTNTDVADINEVNRITALYAKFVQIIIEVMANENCAGCDDLKKHGAAVSFEPAITRTERT